jgi:cyclopropane fatty-acyl-phospholipid synthase-like methyltransferase
VDLSSVALQLAGENLKPLCCHKRLVQQDLMTFLENERGRADLIWSGLAMHHLSTSQKGRFFHRCSEILGSGGYLLIFEPVKRLDESREEHCQRWWKMCESRWEALSCQEKKQIAGHVFGSDYPESLAMLEELAEENAFQKMRNLYTDPCEIYQMLCFEK